MRTYRFASLYLLLLVIAAIGLLFIGVCVGGYYIYDCVRLKGAASAEATAPLHANTAAVVRELDSAKRIVAENLHKKPEDFDSSEIKITFDVANNASLRPNQVQSFSAYLAAARETSEQLKRELLLHFDNSLTALLNSSRMALAQNTAPPVVPHGRPEHVAEVPIPHVDHLYEEPATVKFSDKPLEECQSFLANRVASFTPSQDAKRLAMQASEALGVLDSLLASEVTKYSKKSSAAVGQSLSDYNKEDAQQMASSGNLPKRERISQFINILADCRMAVRETIVSGWRVDSEIEIAEKRIADYRREKAETINSLNGIAMVQLLLGLRYLLVSVLAAVLVLIIRDFLAALVDTAVNTGVMAEKLRSLVVDNEQR